MKTRDTENQKDSHKFVSDLFIWDSEKRVIHDFEDEDYEVHPICIDVNSFCGSIVEIGKL
jgi:hypothetical protein